MSKERENNARPLTTIRFPATGKMAVNGISSSYDEKYRTELSAVLSRDEYQDIVNRLNMTLSAYWPCGLVYYTGCLLVPCTLGMSLLCPMMCVSDAEMHATRLLDNLSLKAKYYDRDISFRLDKACRISHPMMTSQFVISFPSSFASSFPSSFIDEEHYLGRSAEEQSLLRGVVDEEWGSTSGRDDKSDSKESSSVQRMGEGRGFGIQVEPGTERSRLKYT